MSKQISDEKLAEMAELYGKEFPDVREVCTELLAKRAERGRVMSGKRMSDEKLNLSFAALLFGFLGGGMLGLGVFMLSDARAEIIPYAGLCAFLECGLGVVLISVSIWLWRVR